MEKFLRKQTDKMEIDQKKFRIVIDPATAELIKKKFGNCQTSLPRPQQIVEETTQLFSVNNPNTRQLLDAKEKALVSLKNTLGYLRMLTIECNITEPPNIFKDVKKAIEILENDVKL